MENNRFDSSLLPLPWKPFQNEQTDAELQEAWAFWRRMEPDVASTVVQELRREMTEAHWLAKVDCKLVAWESMSRKDYAFLTDKPGAAVVRVHLTFYKETQSWLPAAWPYEDDEAFVRHLLQVADAKRTLAQAHKVAEL